MGAYWKFKSENVYFSVDLSELVVLLLRLKELKNWIPIENVGQELNDCKYFILTLIAISAHSLTEYTFSRHSSLKMNYSDMFDLFWP